MHVFLIAAITLDGYIAQAKGQISTAWTSLEDKKWFGQRTKAAGVVIMGRSTFETVNRPLPGRKTIVMSTQATPTLTEKDGVWWTSLGPRQLIETLEKEGHQEVAVCGGATIYRQFLLAGLIKTLYLTVEPIVFGEGILLFGEGNQLAMTHWQLKKSERLNDQGTLLLEYTL